MRALTSGRTARIRRAIHLAPASGLIAALLLGALPAAALAARGVSIDLGRVTVVEPLAAGDRFHLPRFTIANPGDEPATYEMGVGGFAEEATRSPDRAWFTFSPARFSLEPGRSQVIEARLDLPPDVSPGAYAALVRAEIATDGQGSLVGGAAAAFLRFDVADAAVASPGAAPGAALEGAVDELGSLGWAAVLVVGVAALTAVRRRYRISIGRR